MAFKLDIPMLRAFFAVSEYGSFTIAAETLNITQSTISHQIRKLENCLDRKLLQRTTRSVELTPEGELLLAEAREILALVDAAETRLSDRQLVGEVRLGVPEEIAAGVLPELLARFRESQPNVRLALTVGVSSNLMKAVESHKLDLALIKRVPAKKGLLSVQPLCWAGQQRLISLSCLPLAFFPEPCVFRAHATERLDSIGINYEIVMTTTSHQSLHSATRSGLALTIFARSDCPNDIRINSDASSLPALSNMGYEIYLSPGAGKPARYLEKLLEQHLW